MNAEIRYALHIIHRRLEIIEEQMSDLTPLHNAVASLEAELEATKAYLAGIPGLLAAAAGDQSAVQALADKITADTAALAQAREAAPKA